MIFGVFPNYPIELSRTILCLVCLIISDIPDFLTDFEITKRGPSYSPDWAVPVSSFVTDSVHAATTLIGIFDVVVVCVVVSWPPGKLRSIWRDAVVVDDIAVDVVVVTVVGFFTS